MSTNKGGQINFRS